MGRWLSYVTYLPCAPKGSRSSSGGVDKVFLESGQTKTVSFELTRRDLSYWVVRLQDWVVPRGEEFVLNIGFSSRDIKEVVKITPLA